MELNFSKSMVITIRRVRDGGVAGRFTTAAEGELRNPLTRFTQNLMWTLDKPHLWLYAGRADDEPLTSVIPVFGAMNPALCGDGTCESSHRHVSDIMHVMAKKGMRLFLTPRFGDRDSTLELFADEADIPATALEDVVEDNEVLNARGAPVDATVRAEF